MSPSDFRQPRAIAAVAVLSAVALAGCSGAGKGGAAAAPTHLEATGPLVAPSTSQVQDADYFTKLSQADGELATYMTNNRDVALKALLTDGSAFCAFLARSHDIDSAMYSLAQGSQAANAEAKLPSSDMTFNTIDAVSLISLCPDELPLLPPAGQTRVKQLSATLAGHHTITPTTSG